MLHNDRLTALLAAQPEVSRLIVAYSGGRDSHVLLQRVANDPGLRRAYRLQALHINHGLQAAAHAWAEHCAQVCQTLGITFGCLAVDARPNSGESPEAAARTLRYQALAALLDPHSAVLTAHHQGDQAETVLLAVLRGSGLRGLAAMPSVRALGSGWLWRPLLGCSTAELSDYAAQQNLAWIEDPSNTDGRYRRNLLRQQILPQLHSHWPGLEQTLSRVADHAAEASQILDEWVADDLNALQAVDRSLDWSALQHLSPARQRHVLRHWLRAQGLATPSTTQLQQVLAAMLTAAADRQPCIRWPGVELRRYRQRLYAVRPEVPVPQTELPWPQPVHQALTLPEGGWVQLLLRPGQGLRLTALTATCIRRRHQGERFHPYGRQHSQTLKKLLQDAQIPPWERQRLPLLYCGERLAAVPGVGIAHDLAATGDTLGAVLQWQKSDGSVILSNSQF